MIWRGRCHCLQHVLISVYWSARGGMWREVASKATLNQLLRSWANVRLRRWSESLVVRRFWFASPPVWSVLEQLARQTSLLVALTSVSILLLFHYTVPASLGSIQPDCGLVPDTSSSITVQYPLVSADVTATAAWSCHEYVWHATQMHKHSQRRTWRSRNLSVFFCEHEPCWIRRQDVLTVVLGTWPNIFILVHLKPRCRWVFCFLKGNNFVL